MPPNGFTSRFDLINQSMQFRVALFLYMIITKMLGGTLQANRDVRLKGIEALITGQLMGI